MFLVTAPGQNGNTGEFGYFFCPFFFFFLFLFPPAKWRNFVSDVSQGAAPRKIGMRGPTRGAVGDGSFKFMSNWRWRGLSAADKAKWTLLGTGESGHVIFEPKRKTN